MRSLPTLFAILGLFALSLFATPVEARCRNRVHSRQPVRRIFRAVTAPVRTIKAKACSKRACR